MSILETADTEVGPGYYDPSFSFVERESVKSTFGGAKRFKKLKKEDEDRTLLLKPNYNVNK